MIHVSIGDKITGLLAQWESGTNQSAVSGEVLEELLHHLDQAATVAVKTLPPDAEPLILTKRRVQQLLGCERHMVAMLRYDRGEVTVEEVHGVLLDALCRHRVTTGRLDDPALDTGLDVLRASAEGERIIEWVEKLDGAARGALSQDITDSRDALLSDWPKLRRDWWPRVQDRVRLKLAGGSVIVDGRADVVLAGPPTPRRSVIIETKAGNLRQDDLTDGMFYSLLIALRDVSPPACVVNASSQSNGFQSIWIGEPELHSAAKRLTAAIGLAGELISGRTPRERPGARCRWCPDANECPSAHALEGTLNDDSDVDDEDLDDEPF